MTTMAEASYESRFWIVDAFTSSGDTSLQGNPAGVLITSRHLEDQEASDIARRLNLPALALLSDPDLYRGPTSGQRLDHLEVGIRWIAPTGYWMPLCGHATLATSLALFEYRQSLKTIAFSALRSTYRITADKNADGSARIMLPAAKRPKAVIESNVDGILETIEAASGISSRDVMALLEGPANGDSPPNLLLELRSGVNLQKAPFDPAKLEKLPYHGLWFMAPTDARTKSSLTEDIQTRVFFPSIGIPEDHVCGAAHTLFAPYWLEKQGAKVEAGLKPTLTSRQVSPKGGFLRMQWNGKWAEDNGVVWLSGQGIVQNGQLTS